MNDRSAPLNDPRYADVPRAWLPLTESLAGVVARVVPFWRQELAPAVAEGQRILVVAHGNSIRALVKYLDNISDTAIADLNIPTGRPFVYEMNSQLRPVARYYLDARRTTLPDAAASHPR